MHSIDWVVIAAGLAALSWVNWYFFLAGTHVPVSGVTAMNATGTPSGSPLSSDITIVVDGGYSPSTVVVKAGQPVHLTFDRRDTGSCSEEVVFPDFSLRRFLPPGQKTRIDITPPAPGRYEFMCGMSMLRGVIVAEA